MRDEVIAKYKLDLDALAKEFIWAVNQQHSQGVGLEAFSTVTGTYAATSITQGIGIPGSSGAGLDYYDGLHKSSFTGTVDLRAVAGGLGGNETLTIYENDTTVSVGLLAGDDIDTIMTKIQTALDAQGVAITASKTTGASGEEYLVLTHNNASSGSTFGVGRSAGSGELGLDQSFSIWTYDPDPANPPMETVIKVNSSTTLEEIRDEIISTVANVQASITGGRLQITGTGGYTFAFSNDTSGALAVFGINTFFTGSTAGGMGVNNVIGSDKNYIAGAQIDASGNYASGDNSNALAMTDLQYTSIDIAQWTCDRRNGNTKSTVNATFEVYYHAIVGTIGIKSASVSRAMAFNEAMFSKLGEIRDSISAVSLDEEMTNLIKFQYAYQAAAKLISVSDEMLNTLLSVK
jgi:flagellar hook-associated protein FlgK